ncbi:MAG: hypothetical protein CBE03_000030 [Gammaproteobacteria bacterium TMED243]|nr:hypothetical protein [Gammaproteobacteria bacterium]RPG34477.1 MAG: hypothetical protein CBE03_000030 [Gammaproteobacteria bacterium TMED243]
MEAESHTTPTTVGKAGRAWCPDQYPDFKHPLKNFIMIAFTRPSVALTGYTNELMLHCPKCGDGKNDSYLHLQDFNKNGEDVFLDYRCEFCGNTSTLHLSQHKGHTELLWSDK